MIYYIISSMKVLKILTAPNPLLDAPSKKVVKIDEKIRRLVLDMEATLIAQTDPQGVGLAAVQIGVPLQLFIMKQNPKTKTRVFINPKIAEKFSTSSNDKSYSSSEANAKSRRNSDKRSSLEGCLSVPRIWSPIKRAKKISISYQDLFGETIKKEFVGLPATIIQHELDHLAGILFTRQALLQKSTLYEEINGKLKKMKY